MYIVFIKTLPSKLYLRVFRVFFLNIRIGNSKWVTSEWACIISNCYYFINKLIFVIILINYKIFTIL